MRLYLSALIAWFAILILAILNGIFRETVLSPTIGGAALPVSGLLLISFMTVVAVIMVKKLGRSYSPLELFKVGFFWVLLTVIFEFGFGFARGKSWSELLAAYDLTTGNLWSLILSIELFIPLLVGKWLTK